MPSGTIIMPSGTIIMPSGTIWPEFVSKLARAALASPRGIAAPRRYGVAADGRSCEVRSPKGPLMSHDAR